MSSTLDRMKQSKCLFDENNKEHVELFKQFLRTNSWGKDTCPFMLEFPYLTIPDMIKDRLIYKYLKVERHA